MERYSFQKVEKKWRENNLAISEHDGHPTAKGHKIWFDMLWKFVEENNCM